MKPQHQDNGIQDVEKKPQHQDNGIQDVEKKPHQDVEEAAGNSPVAILAFLETCCECDGRNPEQRSLHCGHSFCVPCLEKHTYKDSITCAMCGKFTMVPKAGVEALKPNIYITMYQMLIKCMQAQSDTDLTCAYCKFSDNITPATAYCQQCDKDMCSACKDKHNERFPEDKVIPVNELQDGMLRKHKVICERHGEQECRYLCRECPKFLCNICMHLGVCNDHKECIFEIFKLLAEYKAKTQETSSDIEHTTLLLEEQYDKMLEEKRKLKDIKIQLTEQTAKVIKEMQQKIIQQKQTLEQQLEQLDDAFKENSVVLEKTWESYERRASQVSQWKMEAENSCNYWMMAIKLNHLQARFQSVTKQMDSVLSTFNKNQIPHVSFQPRDSVDLGDITTEKTQINKMELNPVYEPYSETVRMNWEDNQLYDRGTTLVPTDVKAVRKIYLAHQTSESQMTLLDNHIVAVIERSSNTLTTYDVEKKLPTQSIKLAMKDLAAVAYHKDNLLVLNHQLHLHKLTSDLTFLLEIILQHEVGEEARVGGMVVLSDDRIVISITKPTTYLLCLDGKYVVKEKWDYPLGELSCLAASRGGRFWVGDTVSGTVTECEIESGGLTACHSYTLHKPYSQCCLGLLLLVMCRDAEGHSDKVTMLGHHDSNHDIITWSKKRVHRQGHMISIAASEEYFIILARTCLEVYSIEDIQMVNDLITADTAEDIDSTRSSAGLP